MWTPFKDKKTNRLKVTRITLLVFMVLLLVFSGVYKVTRSVNQVLVKIEHVFEPEPENAIEKASSEVVSKPIPPKPEDTAPESKPLPEKAVEKVAEVKPEPKPEPKTEPPEAKVAQTPVEPEKRQPSKAVEPEPAAAPLKTLELETAASETPAPPANDKPEQKPSSPDKSEPEKAAERLAARTLAARLPQDRTPKEQSVDKKPVQLMTEADIQMLRQGGPASEKIEQTPEKGVRIVTGKMQDMMDRSKSEKPGAKGEVTLPSRDYFEVFRQWQASGEKLDKDKSLVALRIENLEQVYDLFQMKVVAVKEGKPHTDLVDRTRIAENSLSDFSSTCFLVSSPWEKWGDSLKESGFNKDDKIQIRYYTYNIVRNAIYARAMQAFEWSVKQNNLPQDIKPGDADVLGEVHALKRKGGGSFGVFVPRRVDFAGHGSVKIDPLVCFAGQKDIEALSNAGLL